LGIKTNEKFALLKVKGKVKGKGAKVGSQEILLLEPAGSRRMPKALERCAAAIELPRRQKRKTDFLAYP